ncbi:MAG: ATP-binding protein [Candidatus Omnitrophica bacterium]|nr:ATP-binding protein [Candidatus Omnitrophota bacterium]
MQSLKENLKNFVLKIKDEIEEKLEKHEILKLQKEVEKIDKYTGLRVTLINLDGKVIVDSREKPEIMANHRNRPEFIEAVKSGEGYSLRFSPTIRKNMLYYAIFLKEKGVVLRVSFELIYLKTFLVNTKDQLIRLFLFFYIGFLFFYSIVVWFSLKDLPVVEHFVNELAKGNYGGKVINFKIKGFGNMIKELNKISEDLLLISKEVEYQKKLLKLIDLIEIPVAIFDVEGRLIECNSKFSYFLKSEKINKYFWEIIENFQILELIDRTINLKENQKQEIEAGGSHYLGQTIFLRNEQRVLLYFVDISEYKKIENLRNEFIANISHELRTPLTIIKGYIETLEEQEKDEEKRKFIIIIKNQVERLVKIVENILNLSKMEFMKIEFEWINLKDILLDIYRLYEKKCIEKKLEFSLNLTEVPLIKGDKFKLEQSISNIVDNAVKFTEQGQIIINLKQEDKYAVIEIVDSGIGISEDELPFIFEKFYVGKRSKSKTGTGLGLYITKRIIDLHNGKIEVESEINKGTKFKIYLPI